MFEEGILLMIAAGVLQVAVIKYYFANKRRYMRDILNNLQNGEVS